MKRWTAGFLCWMVIGCATPGAVRQLSQEQLQAQEAFGTSLKAVFEVTQRFAEAQKKEANRQIDVLTKQIDQTYAKRAEESLERADTPAMRQSILNELAGNVRSNLAVAESQKAQIAESVRKLREKNQELLTVHTAIVEAQRQLNEYIQLKKLDEVVANQILAMVRLDRQKMNQLITDMATITEDIQKVISTK